MRPSFAPSRTRRAPLAAAAWVLASIVAIGCARDGRFELLSIDPLGTSRLDAGRTLFLEGSGFPVGREVEVSLRGIAHAPLGARRRVLHTLRGRTITPERIELVASDADVSALGGRGTFTGTLEVVVHGASLDGLEARVVGVLEDVRLDIVPSERRASGRSSAHEGLDLRSVLGLSMEADAIGSVEGDAVEETEADEENLEATETLDAIGLRIARMEPRGAAERLGLGALGLEAGARIVALDDMTVLDTDELRVDPRASHATLTILGAAGRERVLSVDLDAARGRRPDRATRYDQLAILVLVAALLFGVWPWSRTSGARTREPMPRDDKPVATVLTASFGILIVLALSTLTPDAWLHGSIPLWLAASLFFRASATLGARGEEVERTEAPHAITTWLARARRSVRAESAIALVSAMTTTVAVGVFLTARGSAESASLPVLGGPLASAAWMPMSWALVRAPFGPFALAALLAGAASTSARIASPTTRAARALRGLDDLGLAALASVFVRVAIADAASVELASRATALVATVVLYAALLRARSAGRAPATWRGPLFASAVASIATIAVAVAWLSLESDGSAASFASEQAVAEVVLVCVGLLVVRVATLGLGHDRPTTSAA